MAASFAVPIFIIEGIGRQNNVSLHDPRASPRWILEAVNDLNSSNNASVEFGQVLCWNPVFAMYARTHGLDFKMREVFTKDAETQDESLSAIARVPIPRNLHGVFFVKHGIEDWLLGKAWREGSPSAFADQIEFRLSNRSKKDNGIHSQNPSHAFPSQHCSLAGVGFWVGCRPLLGDLVS